MAKIPVEIVGKAFTKVKKCVVRGDLVVLEKKSKDHPESTAKFDESCVLRREYGRIRKSYQRRLMIIDGAKECISFKTKRSKLKGPLATLDHDAIKQHFEAEIVHRQGQVHTKLDVPAMLYVLMFIILIVNVFGLILSQSGSKLV